ncbi:MULTISPECIES: hypothetical protein [Bradyrhizobium]|uniref:hypothetical protein n=1 Tax=Bradyrhizobium TaxID=374 RepID=UPI001E598DD1|nr:MULTISPECIES: hypothetical protein [Bradyrhizobium]UFW52194.1 hypothetical protein BaraCB756_14930 [Bradyrhizobium arachidis]
MRRSLLAEALGKPPALGSLRSGCNRRRPSGRSLQSKSLLACQIALLSALLTAQQAVLRLERPLLFAQRPRAFRFLRLELLHALLQTIDASLAFRRLARQDLALPLLHHLLALLDLLLMLLRALFDLVPSRQPLARGCRCVGT